MSIIKNVVSMEATSATKYAIFITREMQRYAVNTDGLKWFTYKEHLGRWEPVSDISAFFMFNGTFQGFDDITSLILRG